MLKKWRVQRECDKEFRRKGGVLVGKMEFSCGREKKRWKNLHHLEGCLKEFRFAMRRKINTEEFKEKE
jgi:hypothetical protein